MGGQQTQGPMMPSPTPTPDPNVPSWATPQDMESARRVQKMLQMQNMLGGTGGPPKPPVDPTLERNKPWATPGPWITQLPPDQEKQFRQWADKNRHQLSMDEMLSPVYDMRGFWKALQAGDPRATSSINEVDKLYHYPDIWKTPYHESFNKQSTYSKPDNPYHWVGDMQDPALVGPNQQVVIPRKSGKPVDWGYRGPE